MKINILPKDDKTNGWSALLAERKPKAHLKGDVYADWVVLGAGYAGLAAARRLGELHPDQKVIVLDAGAAGENASGRNSGFAIDLTHNVGSSLEELDGSHRFMRLARFAIDRLDDLVQTHGIACDWSRDGKYHAAVSPKGVIQVLQPFAHELTALGEPFEWVEGATLAQRLGSSHSITCIAPEDMARIAADAQGEGITQFQVKLGADANWEADAARLRLVREAVGDGPLVYGDWNCGATSLDAIRIGRAVRDLDIMLEQPCKTIEDCARVKASTQLPMKLDEAAKDTASLLKGHALGVMDAVALKLSKFGGLSETRKARDLCLYLGAKMCNEDTWGSDITTAALSHLGANGPQTGFERL